MGGLSGYAAGISQGLRNAATFQNIKTGMASQERAGREEERNLVLQKRADEEYADLNKEIDFNKWTGLLGAGPEAQKFVAGFATARGVEPDKNGMVKKKHLLPVVKELNADPVAQHKLFQFKDATLAKNIDNLKQEIQGQQEGGGLAAIAPLAVKLKTAEDERKQLIYLSEPLYKQHKEQIDAANRKEDVALKEKELGIRKITAEKSHAISNLPAMRDKLAAMPEGPEKESYRIQIKEEQEFQLKEREKAVRTSREYAPSDTEKKFNFWKSLYPNLSDAEIEKKVIKEDIPSETRYVLDSVKEAQKQGYDTPEEIKVAETEARALYRRLTEGAEKPAGQPGIRPVPTKGAAAKRLTYNPKTRLIE